MDVQYRALVEENELLRKEIQVARKAGEITANLVVKQFEETEKILHRFQVANSQRKAVLNSAAQISIIATNREGLITVFNTGAENLLGYRSEEIIGKKTPGIFFIWPPNWKPYHKNWASVMDRIHSGWTCYLNMRSAAGWISSI